MKILFLYLKGFSFTGGIEKFNRSFMKALHEISVDGIADADAISPYDGFTDEKYFPRRRFKGFNGNRITFSLYVLAQSWKYKVIVIGHINLAFIACLIKKIQPSVKIILIAHGIEVWNRQSGYKKRLLEMADVILSVSNFTKAKILENNRQVNPNAIRVFPNTIDPYFKSPSSFLKPQYLLDRYKIVAGTPVLLTVTRLSSSEKYKGYDNVIEVIVQLKKTYPDIKYLLCGKADVQEQLRLINLIEECGVKDSVILTGFVADNELNDHYLLGDVFVMQSKKEGFGIVFIEALACGRKVIAGSKDGSVDALMNGQLGFLIDPDSKSQLLDATLEAIAKEVLPAKLQQLVYENFSFSKYKGRLKSELLLLQGA